jgi:RNA polymerase sigma-70 factor (ECF subfamily)
LNEPELIKRLQDRREDAFEELVHAYKDRIYNTALGFLQHEQDAEEITQEVFIKIFEHIKRFKQEATLSTWIYRITVTQSLDALRKKKRKKRGGLLLSLFGKEDQDKWQPPDFYHPGIAAEQKENAALLFKAISALPEQQQAAFLLQKTEGLSQQQIAAILKTTESSVESLLHRAKANLKKSLQDYYQKHYT